MHRFIHVFGHDIAGYGLMITLGVIVSNILALIMLKKKKLLVWDFVILEGYAGLGMIFGAKLLFLFVSRNSIDWSHFFEPEVFSAYMTSGFVFYGGLIGALLCALLAKKIHKIDVAALLRSCIFFLPLAHGFGRIGCFLGGCCYGIPYDGWLAVTFPDDVGIPEPLTRFPVQLVESALLICLAIVLFILAYRGKDRRTISIYLIAYAIIRFVLEYLRADAARGRFLFLSTSQWVSILIVIAVPAYLIIRGNRAKRVTEGAHH